MNDAADTTTPDRQLGRRIAATIGLLLALVGLAVPAGVTWWGARTGANASDTEEVGVNRLGAATLDIEVGSEEAALGARNLAPGDVVPGEIEITNAGDLPLRYAVTVVTDGGALGRWLLLDAWFTRSACSAVAGADDDVALLGVALSDATLTVAGDPSTGFQDGDRRLAPGQSERLCLAATLPIDAPNEAQGTEIGFDVVVDAEHDIDVETDADGADADRTDADTDDSGLTPRRDEGRGEQEDDR